MAQADERFGVKGSVGIGIPACLKPTTARCMPPTSLLPAANRCAPISALLERDVRLDNDANCFALSEAGMMNSVTIRW